MCVYTQKKKKNKKKNGLFADPFSFSFHEKGEKSSQFEENQVKFWLSELSARLSSDAEHAQEVCPHYQAVLSEL